PGTLNSYLFAFFLANPGGMLFGPLLVWSWRKRRGGRGSTKTLLILGVLFTIGLTGCGEDGTSTIPSSPTPIPPPPMPSITPSSPVQTPTSISPPPPSPTPPGTATEPVVE